MLFGNEEAGLWGAKQYMKANTGSLQMHLYASESDTGAGLVWRFDTDKSRHILETAMPVTGSTGLFKKANAASSGGPDNGPLQEKGVRIFRARQDGSDQFDYHHTATTTLDKIDPEKLNCKTSRPGQ